MALSASHNGGDDALPDTGWGGAYDEGPVTPALPPYDEFHERAVLGSILSQPDRPHSTALLDDLTGFLEPADFFRARSRQAYELVLRTHRRLGGCLIGDLFRDPPPGVRDDAQRSEWSSYLTGLVVDAHPAAVVRAAALHLSALGLDRLLLETHKLAADPNPRALSALHARVQRKRDLLDAARTGDPTAPAAGAVAAAGMEIPE